jgi:hypothetical protein
MMFITPTPPTRKATEERATMTTATPNTISSNASMIELALPISKSFS